MIRNNRGRTMIKKRVCPECGNKKAAVKYGYMACMECGYLYPKVEKDDN